MNHLFIQLIPICILFFCGFMGMLYFRECDKQYQIRIKKFLRTSGFHEIPLSSLAFTRVKWSIGLNGLNFQILSKGYNSHFKILAEGHLANSVSYLGEYEYSVPMPKAVIKVRICCAAFVKEGRNLPYFSVCPINYTWKLLSALGLQYRDIHSAPDKDFHLPDHPNGESKLLRDIELPGNEELLKKFRIRSYDVNAAQPLFNAEFVQALKTSKGMCIEGYGPVLLVYSNLKRVPIEELDQFLVEARNLSGYL